MYQFTTTTILNSATDSNGSLAKYAGSATGLNVTRVGFFKTANVVSVFKTPYAAGVKEIAHVTIPTITSGLVARLSIDVRLSQQTDSEYANTYLYFKKPVVVEVLSTGVDTTTATALVAQINALKDRYGFSYITAATSGADIHITATNNNQRIFDIKILKEAGTTGNSLIEPWYEDVTASTFHVATPGKLGFGDDEYMVKSIMLPTYENSRYFGTNKEERPILGANYSQYTLRYQIAKTGTDGILGGGTSITTHVFYVPAANVATFEAALVNASIPFQDTTLTVTDVTITSGNLDISSVVGGAPYVTTYTTTPLGATGAVFTLDTAGSTVAGSADWTKVAVTPAGVVTLTGGHGLAAADLLGLTVVIDGVTLSKTLTLQA